MRRKNRDPGNSIILWQSSGYQMRTVVLGSDPEQNKKDLLALLSERDETWNQDTWLRAWTLVEYSIQQKILTEEDLPGLLTCSNDSVCLALWKNAEFLISKNLMKKSDFEQHKAHFFAILSHRDDTWDYWKGETVLNIIEHLVDEKILTGPDLVCLFSCANDCICFCIWKDAKWLLQAGLLEQQDIECYKDRFIALITDHCSEWEGVPAWGDEDGVWSVIKNLKDQNILTHDDFRTILSGDNDRVCIALWKNAKFLIHEQLLDVSDLRQSKKRFLAILSSNIHSSPVIAEDTWWYGRTISAGDLIGDLVDLGLLTKEDSTFFLSLLDCENRDMCLAAWENAYLLIQREILDKEDFIRNRDHVKKFFLISEIPDAYRPEPHKKLFKFLVEAGIFTLDTLYLMLDTEDLMIKYLAEEAVNEITHEQTIDARIEKLWDEDPATRYSAARDLEESYDEYTVGRLISLLRDKNIFVRYHAAEIFRKISSPSACFPLVRALNEDDASVRFQVCYALKGNTFEFLSQISTDTWGIEEWTFREIVTAPAVDALIVHVIRLDETWLQETAERVIEKTGLFHEVDEFIRALDNDDTIAMHNAASAFIAIAPEDAVDVLIRAMNDNEASARETAVRAAERLNAEYAAGALIEALKDTDATVRYYAARALGGVRSDQSAGALIQALDDEVPMVRCNAAKALGTQQSILAVDSLIKALGDPEVHVRFFVAIALGEIRSVVPVEALTLALKDENVIVQIAAQDALEQIELVAIKV